jgi:hypothetical protein
VPIDYGDVIRVVWEHPWGHSSVVAVADWEIDIQLEDSKPASAAVVKDCIRHSEQLDAG